MLFDSLISVGAASVGFLNLRRSTETKSRGGANLAVARTGKRGDWMVEARRLEAGVHR